MYLPPPPSSPTGTKPPFLFSFPSSLHTPSLSTNYRPPPSSTNFFQIACRNEDGHLYRLSAGLLRCLREVYSFNPVTPSPVPAQERRRLPAPCLPAPRLPAPRLRRAGAQGRPGGWLRGGAGQVGPPITLRLYILFPITPSLSP